MSHVTWMTHLRHRNDSLTSHEIRAVIHVTWNVSHSCDVTHSYHTTWVILLRGPTSHEIRGVTSDRTNGSRHTNDSCHMNNDESRPIIRMTHVTCYEWVTPYKWLTSHGWHKELSGTCFHASRTTHVVCMTHHMARRTRVPCFHVTRMTHAPRMTPVTWMTRHISRTTKDSRHMSRTTQVICHRWLTTSQKTRVACHKWLMSLVTNDSRHTSRTTRDICLQTNTPHFSVYFCLLCLYATSCMTRVTCHERRAALVTNDTRHMSQMTRVMSLQTKTPHIFGSVYSVYMYLWICICLLCLHASVSTNDSRHSVYMYLSICICLYVPVYMHLSRRTTHVICCKRHTSPV